MTRPTAPFVAGLDLGSTGFKILLLDAHGNEVAVAQRSTPWQTTAAGTEMTAGALRGAVTALLSDAAVRLQALGYDTAAVAVIAISGMGESGLLVDESGTPVAPAIAWFDRRGGEYVDRLPAHLSGDFAERTGLPLGVQVSLAKLLMLSDHGVDLRRSQWLGLPEYVAAALGGRRSAELSLASRTGLLDQDTARPWPQMLEYLKVDPDFIPALVTSGSDLGSVCADCVPRQFQGARITVAGHDHLVAATAGGARADGTYYASMGTAEVLVRVLDEPLAPDARGRLAGHLINHVHHVIPGQHVLVAGVKTGLLMRRVLQLSGIDHPAGRDALDAQVLALRTDPATGQPLESGTVEVSGARNDDGVLAVTVRADGVGPADLFAAALRHGNDELARLISAMDREIAPATATLLTGGWAGMRSVQRARARVLPHLKVSMRTQDTAYGAAQSAARLLTSLTSPADPADAEWSPQTTH